MKKFIFFAILLASSMGFGFAAKYTISNSGTTFTPATITMEAGEDVEFSLGSSHNAVEVLKETWDANGNTSKSGGFSVPFGGGELVFNTPGTYYYVCTPHASLGMKGVIIVVSSSTAVPSVSSDIMGFDVYSSAGSDFLTLSYTLQSNTDVNIRLINSVGAEVSLILNEPQVAGEYQFAQPLQANLKPGLYLVAIKTDHQYTVKKLVLR